MAQAGTERSMTRIAHLSDIHFGRIAYPEIVEVLVEEVNALAVDLVIVSGDLTQRARPRQFEDAVAMLDAFTAPVLVVPGNHDVHAWWHRPVSRLVRPLRRYRQYVTDDLTPTFAHDAVAVLGINSAYGWTIKGGWIRADVPQRIGTFFQRQHADAFKILVVHHHLKQLVRLGPHDVARRAHRALTAVAEAGVDLLLCGHLHVSHVEAVEPAARRRLVIACAGTATSNRWREPQRDENYYNVIEIDPGGFTIEERLYNPRARAYSPARQQRFGR